MLREQIVRLLQGESRFSVLGGLKGFTKQPRVNFEKFRNQFVIWPLDNSVESVWLFLSALGDGVIPVVVPAKWPTSKLRYLGEMFPGFGVFQDSQVQAVSNPSKGDGAIFIALMTSGSTGDPQAIATSEDRLTRGIQFIADAQGIATSKSTGILLPISYSYALVNQLFWAIMFERSVALCDTRMGPVEALRSISGLEVDMLCMVAAQIETINRLDSARELCVPGIRTVNFAGAPFPASRMGYLRELFPDARFLNNYGCTEAMPRLTVREVRGDYDDFACVGRPIGDIKLRIEGGDKHGPILFQGSSTALGKLSSQGELIPFSEWTPSGDWGELRDGELYIAGRRDQVVKIDGERFSLLEVEQILLSVGFDHAAVWLDSASNKVVAAVRGSHACDPEQIRRAIKERLAKPAWPREVYSLGEWPLNANGKTNRTKIQEWHRDGSLTNRVL